MNPIVRNIVAVVVGIVVGALVNGALISISGHIIPPPEGVDVNSVEGLKAGIHLFEPKHFIFPFLAHALGTLVGALVATLLSVDKKLSRALLIGGVFLLGGISNCVILPAPLWFEAVDILFAYLPMAFIGWKLATLKK